MVKKTMSYADALRVLGKDDSAALAFAETLLEGTLATLGVPDFFGLREKVLEHGREAVIGIREKISGVSRWDRTERIEAANQILRITAFFEACGEILDRPGSPLSLADLEFTRDEQVALFTDTLNSYGPVAPLLPPAVDEVDRTLSTWHDKSSTVTFISGLAVWERLSATDQDRLRQSLEDLPELAERRYRESYRRLAADIPEFGVWVNLDEHARTRENVDRVSTGLAEVEGLLRRVTATSGAQRRLTELNRLYRSVLDKPMLPTVEAPEGAVFPTVERSYLNPRGRLKYASPGSLPSTDSWWQDATRYDDLQPLLVALLTQWRCRTSPVVLLGHPGAGKSQLTRMLAARLPAGEFLPLRVELRGVQADAPVHRQIEEGISGTLGADVSWRELCDSAEGALPVVLLDGFDELLQATGVNRSDYLEQVQQFQERQADLGNPVAVIVTSRTVVADRTRFPHNTPVIRLEPFDDAQIGRMLRIWNQANAAPLAARGMLPLPLDVLLRYRELAEQPLLLLLLLIFDSDTNVLQRSADGLGRGELYERLLAAFAERDVRKHRAHLSTGELREAVEGEMRRLEVVAMAMFARHGQTVTAEELDQDLAVLFPEAAVRADDAGLHGHISPADQVLGRFFFMHEARAVRNERQHSVYEFLHATFGEYLVARMVVNALDELVADRRHARRKRFAEPLNDGLLYALTSFAALAGRAAVVEFTADLLARRIDDHSEDRDEYRDLLLELFADALYPAPNRSFTAYEPERLTVPHRYGVYTANLILLLVTVVDEEIDLGDLYPSARNPWQEWRALVGLWRGKRAEDWHGTVEVIRLRHLGYWDGEPRTVLERERGERVNVGECVGFELRADVTEQLSINNPYEITVPFEGVTSKLLRSIALRANGTASRMVLMLLPYLRHVSDDLGTWYQNDDTGTAWAEAHEVLELRLGPPVIKDAESRLFRYFRLLNSFRIGRIELLVLTQAAEDLDLLSERAAKSLRALLTEFLRHADLVPGPRLGTRYVNPVMDALRLHLQTSEALDRICGLAAANDTAVEPAPDPDPPSHQHRNALRSGQEGSA